MWRTFSWNNSTHFISSVTSCCFSENRNPFQREEKDAPRALMSWDLHSVLKLRHKVNQLPVNPWRTWKDEPQVGTPAHQTWSRKGSGLFDGERRRSDGSQETRRFLLYRKWLSGSYWNVPPVILLKSSPLFLMTRRDNKIWNMIFIWRRTSIVVFWSHGYRVRLRPPNPSTFLTAHLPEILD